MNIKELNDNFRHWNPMEQDYKNTEFNLYTTGPGAELDVELQPSQQALLKNKGGQENQKAPTLVFKHLPKDMTKKAMHNICSRYGRVTSVRDSTKNDYYFVDFATISDMEAAIRALENNCYGFKVEVSNSRQKNPVIERSSDQSLQNDNTLLPQRQSNTEIDYSNRSYRTSKQNHPRPKVEEDSPLSGSNTLNIAGMSLNLLLNDAHSLERQDLYKVPNNNNFSYRNGRSFKIMPTKVEQFMDKKHKESLGSYNSFENKFLYTNEVPMPNNIQKCSVCLYACDTFCERCSQYYCSVECQLGDWQEHRYKCGKPKHLQTTPPSEKTVVKNVSKSPEISKNSAQGKAPNVQQSKRNEVKEIQVISVETFPQKTASTQPTKSIKPTAKKLPAFVRALAKQSENSSRESPQQLIASSQSSPHQAANSFNFASNKTSTENKKVVNSPKETFQQHKNSSTAPSLPLSNRTAGNCEELYKQHLPRSGAIVTITAILKTNVVFIRSVSYDDNLSYFATVDGLQSIGKMLLPLKALPKSGEVVVAKFEEQFNRALVLKVNNSKNIVINFMDYGNSEQVKMEELFLAPRELIYKPRHAVPVLLKDVPEFYMTDEIRQFMHTYLNDINVELRYKLEDFRSGKNVYAVELIDESTQQNFNKMIMKLSKPVEPADSTEICDRGYLKTQTLPVGKNVELVVMDNSLMVAGCISCTTKAYAIEIEKFKKTIQDYIESIPNDAYTPRVNELCIARYNEDGLWYRGVCIETVGDGYPSIHFIDYGNITMVRIDNIRRYPRQFTYPMLTFDCAIEDLPEECNEAVVDELERLIPNGELIKCENVTVDKESNFYSLSLPNVIRELTICGLI